MRRKTATFAALVLSTALTSTATPAAELSQAVDTTQEIPMEAEEPVLTDRKDNVCKNSCTCNELHK